MLVRLMLPGTIADPASGGDDVAGLGLDPGFATSDETGARLGARVAPLAGLGPADDWPPGGVDGMSSTIASSSTPATGPAASARVRGFSPAITGRRLVQPGRAQRRRSRAALSRTPLGFDDDGPWAARLPHRAD